MRTTLTLLLLAAFPLAAEEVYRVRYDQPSIFCYFMGSRCGCEGKHLYPETPHWTISQGDTKLVEERESDVVFFDMEPKQWTEVYTWFIRNDGELIELNMLMIYRGALWYYTPLNAQTVSDKLGGPIPPQWKDAEFFPFELPEYQSFYAQRADRYRTD